jgi:hypothetical protein
VALLAPKALALGDREPGDADLGKRFAHLVELERFDDGGDSFIDSRIRARTLRRQRQASIAERGSWRPDRAGASAARRLAPAPSSRSTPT